MGNIMIAEHRGERRPPGTARSWGWWGRVIATASAVGSGCLSGWLVADTGFQFHGASRSQVEPLRAACWWGGCVAGRRRM